MTCEPEIADCTNVDKEIGSILAVTEYPHAGTYVVRLPTEIIQEKAGDAIV